MEVSKLILSAAAVIGVIAGASAASAADFVAKAPYAAAPPAFSWTGCYVGVHAGGGMLREEGWNFTGTNGMGALAGGQLGCSYQYGMLVLGLEGEGFWSGMRSAQDAYDGSLLVGNGTVKNKWDYDVAARVGVAFDRALVYGKAGWVAGGFEWNDASFDGTRSDQAKASLQGLLVGLGLEYAFTNSWTTKFEYDYLGFETKNIDVGVFCAFCTPVNFVEKVRLGADKHIFKVGVNYKFY